MRCTKIRKLYLKPIILLRDTDEFLALSLCIVNKINSEKMGISNICLSALLCLI